MFLKYFYDDALAHASYMVGCQQSQVAIVVDPGRDIEQYLAMANREQVTLVAVAETHIHADFVSGALELADRVGAKLYLSDAGPSEWKYQFADDYEHQLIVDGDSFAVGKIKFDVMHTPGHTPESLSFLLTDLGGGADVPMGIFTGDFVFVGSIGRPDLLEEAAGIENTAEPGARDLFHSLHRFKQLPDFLQIWPAHGAGSACGKGLGAIPSSTVGYEKLFNPAFQFEDEDQFVQYILDDQPEAPKYFALMKQVNKEGPQILGVIGLPERLDSGTLHSLPTGVTLLDLSPSGQFAKGHVPGSINIPLSMLAAWAGWIVNYEKPVYLISSCNQLSDAMRILWKIGLESVAGVFDIEVLRRCGLTTQCYESALPEQLAPRIRSGDLVLLDVRSDAEWQSSQIPCAEHHFLGRLPERVGVLRKDKAYVTQCQSSARSAIAASILQAEDFRVIDMSGGLAEWHVAGLPISTEENVIPCGT